MTMRDEFPSIRYRRQEDWSIKSQRFASAEEFAAEGGEAAGWARSPALVRRDPNNIPQASFQAPSQDEPKLAKAARARKGDVNGDSSLD